MREQQDWLLAAEEENLRSAAQPEPVYNGVEEEEPAEQPTSEEVGVIHGIQNEIIPVWDCKV